MIIHVQNLTSYDLLKLLSIHSRHPLNLKLINYVFCKMSIRSRDVYYKYLYLKSIFNRFILCISIFIFKIFLNKYLYLYLYLYFHIEKTAIYIQIHFISKN